MSEKVEKEEVVVLTEDNKTLGLKELKDLYNAAGTLYEWVKSDTLTVEMKETLFSLIESYTAGAGKYIGFDSMAQEKIDKMHEKIRAANDKIRGLEEKLADSASPDMVKEFLDKAHWAMYTWWKSFGFSLVTDDSFNGYGYKARFCLDIGHISFISTHPSKDKKESEDRLQKMLDDGWKLKIPNRERSYHILDTPDNRDKIYALIRQKFRSAKITKWENWNLGQSDEFYLRDFEIIIYDYQEIKDLIEFVKTLKEEDE
jgi:hypothetical protein